MPSKLRGAGPIKGLSKYICRGEGMEDTFARKEKILQCMSSDLQEQDLIRLNLIQWHGIRCELYRRSFATVRQVVPYVRHKSVRLSPLDSSIMKAFRASRFSASPPSFANALFRLLTLLF